MWGRRRKILLQLLHLAEVARQLLRAILEDQADTGVAVGVAYHLALCSLMPVPLLVSLLLARRRRVISVLGLGMGARRRMDRVVLLLVLG